MREERKQKIALDLNAAENADLLADIEKLRSILINNQNIRRILVSPKLAPEQRALIGELLPDVRYSFDDTFFDSDFGKDLGYENNFEMFLTADMIYDSIIAG